MNSLSPARCTWRMERFKLLAKAPVVPAELAVAVGPLGVGGNVLLPQQLSVTPLRLSSWWIWAKSGAA